MIDGNYQIDYQEINLDTIMRYFAAGFEPKEGRELWQTEWFIDVNKKCVVFKLSTRDKQ